MTALRHILFFNPPGPLYQRGEDRCQASVDDSSAVSLRAPNDLAYMAAMVRTIGITPMVRDYPAEQLTWEHFESDLKTWCPDMIVMSITTATLLDDLAAFDRAKARHPGVITVAKGAFFFACDLTKLDRPEFRSMDYALVGESETVINDLIAGLTDGTPPSTIPNIIHHEGSWKRTRIQDFEKDIDTIPFPARDLLKNERYVRPDTGEPQATIQTSRGCPSKCVFCLTPLISGERVRQRSAKNVVDEIEVCVTRHGIRNFFFKADTFTINKTFVIDLCREILDRRLDIEWVANSRVDTVDEERLSWMKKAGCWLVAFGFESGHDAMLRLMKKEATTDDARRAVRLTKAAGLRIYGFFMIGLPWETHETIRRTLDFAKELDCDFSEIHLATPYEGTSLHDIVRETGLLTDEVIGHNYFSDPVIGSMFLSREELLQYRKEGLRKLYFSPAYVARTFGKIRSARELGNYFKYGVRMIRNVLG